MNAWKTQYLEGWLGKRIQSRNCLNKTQKNKIYKTNKQNPTPNNVSELSWTKWKKTYISHVIVKHENTKSKAKYYGLP